MSIESIFSGLHREITRLKTTVDDLNRRVVVAPLNAGKSKQLTIASGSVVATRPFILLTPESGTADDLTFIDNGSDGKMVVLMNAREGDTITVQDYSGGGTANIDLGGDATFALDNVHDSLVLIYRESTAHWERIGLGGTGGGGGATSFTDLTDAPSSYAGEAGNVVAVNATEDGLELIPPPGGAVDSVNGQTGVVVLDSDDIAEGATNLYISDVELIKLAGIESLADVTDAANVGAAIDNATQQTTLEDTNRVALIDDGVLKWSLWSTIKTALTTLFNGLYVALTGNQTIEGNKTFTSATTINVSAAGTQQILHAYAPNADYVQFNFGNSNAIGEMGQFEWDNLLNIFKFQTAGHAAPIRLGANWLFLDTNGNVGFGTGSPQGRYHAHDGTAGWLKVSKTGVAGTAVTLIPDGTGDCLYRMDGKYVVRASDGTVLSGSFNANNGGSAILYNAGGHILILGINANGSVYVQRTAGSLTFTVALDMIWL